MKRLAKWVGIIIAGTFCLGLFGFLAERYLLPEPDPVEVFDNPEAQALARAALARDGAAFDALIATGADINAQGADGITLLQWRVLRGDLSGTSWLLKRGADPNMRGYFGETALHIAAARAHPNILGMLLDAGGDPNATEERLDAPVLFTALMSRRDKSIAMLIARGADIEFADTTGKRALMLAAAINDSDSVVMFLKRGADPLAKDNLGFDFQSAFFRTDPAIMHSQALRNRDWVIRFLQERGIDVVPAAFR